MKITFTGQFTPFTLIDTGSEGGLSVQLYVDRGVSCEHRILTCIAAVEHLYTLGVPVLHKNMVTVELQLVSLAVVMALVHESRVVHIFGPLMPNILREDRGWVRPFRHFVNIAFQLSCPELVLLVPEVILVIDSDVKSLGIGGLLYE